MTHMVRGSLGDHIFHEDEDTPLRSREDNNGAHRNIHLEQLLVARSFQSVSWERIRLVNHIESTARPVEGHS